MRNPLHHPPQFFFLLCLWFFGESAVVRNGSSESTALVQVGVVLDLKSKVGEMAECCISIALSDFYDIYTNYSTRLVLHTIDSRGDVVGAASAALYLMKDKEVQVIIGPQQSEQAKFMINLGEKAQVPVVSFSATSPSLSPTKNSYFIRTTLDDCSQVKAIASIFQAYGWKEVVLIYEDTEYGNGLLPYLSDAFQEINVRMPYRCVIPVTASDDQILKDLYKLMTMQTRVFLVHMTASIGSRLFIKAKNAGMMHEGYAWITTSGLSSLLDPIDSYASDSLHGVLGVKPYIQSSKQLEDFKLRWKRKFLSKKPESEITEPTLFGIWAYDTVWALAMAIERVGTSKNPHHFLRSFNGSSETTFTDDLSTLIGYSNMGPKLGKTIRNIRFKGLSGDDFHLIKGQLQSSVFQIFNVIGKGERVIGFWTAAKGLSRNLNAAYKKTYSASENDLKAPIWPGDSTTKPKGWVIPTNGPKLRIGVPVKEGFTKFVKVENKSNEQIVVTGFSIDVFKAARNELPFHLPYEFIPFGHPGGTVNYDELICAVKNQTFDAVVGDTTIVVNRSFYVDFTLPYTDSGVSMVVPIKDKKGKNAWVFLKPMSWDLWLTSGVAFIFTGIVVWILEHRINTDFRGPPTQQLGLIFWFAFSTLVFTQRERVVNNLSRFVLIIWMFVVLILQTSYTASLTSMLTVERLQPTVTDIAEIKKNGYYVGYQNGSFVKDLLIKRLNLEEPKLRPYNSPEEYHDALSDGTVAAIIDEIPYIKVFLSKHCSKYIMVGPTYKTGGFGFVFPLGSPLVSHMSRAILKITQGEEIDRIESSWFEQQTECGGLSAEVSSTSNSISLQSFWGLFLITGLASGFSLLIYLLRFAYDYWHDPITTTYTTESFGQKILNTMKYFDQKDLSSHNTFKRTESRIHPVTEIREIEISPPIIHDSQSLPRISSQTDGEDIVQDGKMKIPTNLSLLNEPMKVETSL